MHFISIVRTALRSLRRSPLRSVLTTLGIILGVGSVIIMIGLGTGARKQIADIIARLDHDMIKVIAAEKYPSRPGRRTFFYDVQDLTVADYEAIRQKVGGIAAMTLELSEVFEIETPGLRESAQVKGGSADYLSILSHKLISGVMFGDIDVNRADKVCIISRFLAEQLFPISDPIGRLLLIKGEPFTVLGVFDPAVAPGQAAFGGSGEKGLAVIPYTSFIRRLQGSSKFSTITIRATDIEHQEALRLELDDLMQQRRGDRSAEIRVIVGSTQLPFLEAQNESGQVMTLLLGAMGSISLVVGGIGIMNIMLVSVTERTREIGLRLAVGGRGRDIMRQFLIEAVVLSLVGGLFGIALGSAGTWALTNMGSIPALERMVGAMGSTKFKPIVSSEAVIVAFLSCVVIGVFFGWYPARKAAQLDPIEALRHE